MTDREYIECDFSLQRAVNIAKRLTQKAAATPEYLITNKEKRSFVELAKSNPKGYWILTTVEANELLGMDVRSDGVTDARVKRVWCVYPSEGYVWQGKRYRKCISFWIACYY